MAAQVITAPIKSVESHQVTTTAATSATETAGALKIVVPNGTTNEQLRRALLLVLDASRVAPNVFQA